MKNIPKWFQLPPRIASFALLTLTLAVSITGCGGGGSQGGTTLPITNEITSAQSILGNPDGAVVDENNHDKYLSQKPQYDLSYSDNNRIANWVAWHLESADLGDAARTNAFAPDTSLPSTFTRIVTGDYTNSGYDRGHQCPSADRTATTEDNKATFLMSNMAPQQHGLNAGPWESLEEEARNLVEAGNECYIYSGPVFNSTTHNTIGEKNISVPSSFWKILVVLPDANGDDRTRVNANTRVVAVKMPNISTVSGRPWREYRVSPAEIEAMTGLKFFTTLPSDVASMLRSKIDTK
jgi:endonuclease G, mitochondrial